MKLTAYHGNPKKFERFTEYRKQPNEQHKISVRYPAVIAMHASQISIRYWDEMTKWEWEERMAEEEQEELEELLPEEE